MNDKELLMMAAKAAGVVGEYVEDYSVGDYYADQFYTGPDCGILTGKGHLASVWNPLTDDGDALRLSVSLKIRIAFVGDCVSTCAINSYPMDANMGVDEYAATRRAIVRAAAEIGSKL